MKVKEQIKEIMNNNPEMNVYTARYIVYKMNKGKSYKSKPRKDLTKKVLESEGISIFKNLDSDYSYEVYQNGLRRPIAPLISGQYKNTKRTKYHLYTWCMIDGKQKSISLASLIMVLIIGKDIPSGYVVDHIDNDSFNNDISNLQLLTIGENAKKDNNGHNQYTKA